MMGKSELCYKLMLEYIVNLFPCCMPYIYECLRRKINNSNCVKQNNNDSFNPEALSWKYFYIQAKVQILNGKGLFLLDK